MRATASNRIRRHITRIIRRRLSEVLLVSIDGFDDSMMKSDAITIFDYMKMCLHTTSIPLFVSVLVAFSRFMEIEYVGY